MSFVLVWHYQVNVLERVTKPFKTHWHAAMLFRTVAKHSVDLELQTIEAWMRNAQVGDWTRIYGTILIAIGDAPEAKT